MIVQCIITSDVSIMNSVSFKVSLSVCSCVLFGVFMYIIVVVVFFNSFILTIDQFVFQNLVHCRTERPVSFHFTQIVVCV